MANLKYGITGILLAVFGILLTIAGWFWIPAFDSFFEIDLMRGIFWIGLLTTWISAFVITPYTLIVGGKGDIAGVAKGCLAFLIGTITSIISYWVVFPVVDALETIFTSTYMSSIAWIMMMIIWILGMIVVPLYLILNGNNPLKKEGN